MTSVWEKELIKDLKNLIACQRSVRNIKAKYDHLAQMLDCSQNINNKAYYERHLVALEVKLKQTKSFVSRLKKGLAILSVAERAVLFELYINPSGKKKIGSQGQVYRLKGKAMQKLFVEFNGYNR